MMSRVLASYERISRFREDVSDHGATTSVTVDRGVDRQRADAIRYADNSGLGSIPVDRFYRDNNRSASKYRTKEREDFERLLIDIDAGEISHVLVWVLDRIVRDLGDMDRLFSACATTGTLIVQTATGSMIDPRDPDSVFVATVTGAGAAREAAMTSLRARRKHAETAARGGVHGGRRRFGFTDGMQDIEPDEADRIREACQRIIEGDTLHRIAKDWADQGVTSPSGATWTGPNLRAMLMGAHHVKVRIHNTADAGGRRERGITTSTQMIDATWPAPAILDRADWETMRAILTDPRRRTNGSPARVHAYTGIARCGVCGGPMRCRQDGRPGRKTDAYICVNGAHAQRVKAFVHDVIADEVAAYIERHRIDVSPVQDDGEKRRQARADALIRRKTDLAAMLGDVDTPLDPNAYAVAVARIDADLAAIQSDRVETRRPSAILAPLLEAADYDAVRSVFVDLSIDRQREIVSAIGTIYIDPAKRRGGVLDASSVRLEVHPH